MSEVFFQQIYADDAPTSGPEAARRAGAESYRRWKHLNPVYVELQSRVKAAERAFGNACARLLSERADVGAYRSATTAPIRGPVENGVLDPARERDLIEVIDAARRERDEARAEIEIWDAGMAAPALNYRNER